MVFHSSKHKTQHRSDDQLEVFRLPSVIITCVKCISTVHICTIHNLYYDAIEPYIYSTKNTGLTQCSAPRCSKNNQI